MYSDKEAFMKISITSCPFCGGSEFVKGIQGNQGRIYSVHSLKRSQYLVHIICLECGSVVRSYVNEPEKLAPEKATEE